MFSPESRWKPPTATIKPEARQSTEKSRKSTTDLHAIHFLPLGSLEFPITFDFLHHPFDRLEQRENSIDDDNNIHIDKSNINNNNDIYVDIHVDNNHHIIGTEAKKATSITQPATPCNSTTPPQTGKNQPTPNLTRNPFSTAEADILADLPSLGLRQPFRI